MVVCSWLNDCGDVLRQGEFDVIMASSELPHECKLLYTYLRRHMDYKTNQVGRVRKISYQSIREFLEYLPPACSRSPSVSYSRDQVKRFLLKLKSVGAIVPLHDQDVRSAMIFYMPLAVAELVCFEDERPMSATSVAPVSAQFVDNFSSDERHTSVISNTTTKLNNLLSTRGLNISTDWVPTKNTVDQLSKDYGYAKEFIFSEAVQFKIYWLERGGVCTNWDSKFLARVRGRISDGAAEFISAMDQSWPSH